MLEWLEEATERGAGEVLITSVDKDGTGAGYDLDLLQMVSAVSRIPVVASGGYGEPKHIRDLFEVARPEGIAIGRPLPHRYANFSRVASTSWWRNGRFVTAKKPVKIIDYGFGNVRSVLNALDKCGFEPQVVSTVREVEKSSSIVLPVGVFATAMRVITNKGLDLAIREAVGSGAAILGICLGMQLLLKSLEFGEHLGLGLLEGTVGPLVPPENVSPEAKSTHISWAQVTPRTTEIGRLVCSSATRVLLCALICR